MGGVCPGGDQVGERGQGSENKIPFIVAIETMQDGWPIKVRLRRVSFFRRTEIVRYAQSRLLPGSEVLSERLYCFAGASAFHYRYLPRYQVKFEYRFNRRYDLQAMTERLTSVAIRARPMPYRPIKKA